MDKATVCPFVPQHLVMACVRIHAKWLSDPFQAELAHRKLHRI